MYFGERTMNDMKQMNSLIGQTFYERNPKNNNEIRTYYMRFNGIANRIVPAISNWHVAEPTPEMKPFHPRIMTAIMTKQPNSPEFY